MTYYLMSQDQDKEKLGEGHLGEKVVTCSKRFRMILFPMRKPQIIPRG